MYCKRVIAVIAVLASMATVCESRRTLAENIVNNNKNIYRLVKRTEKKIARTANCEFRITQELRDLDAALRTYKASADDYLDFCLNPTSATSATSPTSPAGLAEAPHWTYFGTNSPPEWASVFPECGGQEQSPVDLPITLAAGLTFDARLDQLFFGGSGHPGDVSNELTNNGHAVQVNYITGDLRMTGGDLGGEFRVAQFHFHWGENDFTGSEHTVGGNAYPMEMHIVTYNRNYASLSEAVGHKDGLAVLGIFITTSSMGATDRSTQFAAIVNRLNDINDPGNTTSLPAMSLTSLLPADRSEYFRYQGSLTTPPCSEVVTWTVLRDPVYITPSQLAAFRIPRSSETENGVARSLAGNFRPVQPLNSRVVTASFNP